MCAFYQRLDINKEQSFLAKYSCLKRIQQWGNQIKNNGGQNVILVALVHLVLIACGISFTVKDIIIQQYPSSLYEIGYVLGYFVAHFLLVASLLTGTVKEKPVWYIPWILIMFILFSQMSFLWIQSLFKGATYYLTATIVNVIVLSLAWFGWWTVTKHFLYMWSTRKSQSAIGATV